MRKPVVVSRQQRYQIQWLVLLLWTSAALAIRFPGPLFSCASVTTSTDSSSSVGDDSKKSPWWKGLDLGEKGRKKTKEKKREEGNETYDGGDEEEFSPEEVLSPLQLEPLLQIPCSVQIVFHDASSSSSSSSSSASSSESHPIEAFCDTGAQRTVMSWTAAQHLGLAHLVDRRYRGHATGVGSCRVLGRIPAHAVRLQFAGIEGHSLVVTAPAITVLESTGTPGVDLLLGLDFLRDTKAVIDLQKEEVRLVSSGRNTDQKPSKARIPFVQHRNSLDLDAKGGQDWDDYHRHGSSKRKDSNKYNTEGDHEDDDVFELDDNDNSEHESANSDEEMDMSWL